MVHSVCRGGFIRMCSCSFIIIIFLFLGYIIFFKVLSIVNFGWVGLLVSLRKGAGGRRIR